ncbi:unnamed protein product [Anisakis simplex]|uniref:Iodotyrosine dehalogenase 1 (inferred by orthology to a human protein) n=1 Tax=Anisakis simplex TaxID=6269 RepID=A0A0M3JP66_ANISI|nr:unnamed protein product [Anisakis simplex]
MGVKWVLDVSDLNVHWCKPYLTEAPFIIVIMKQIYAIGSDGERRPPYYNEVSVAIATGLLIAAIHV